MEYKVVPFTANINRNNNSATVAAQLQLIIDQHLLEGWAYQHMESVETSVCNVPQKLDSEKQNTN